MILQLLPFVACMHLGDIKSIYRFSPHPVQIKKKIPFFSILSDDSLKFLTFLENLIKTNQKIKSLHLFLVTGG